MDSRRAELEIPGGNPSLSGEIALAAGLQHHSAMSPSILLVDDEPSYLAAVSEFFIHLDYRVVAAQELEEAEALIITSHFSLVIVDLSLTNFNSDEGLRLIDLIGERSPETKIILLSGRVSPEVRAEALKRGAHAVLNKPQHLADIGALAERLLEVPNEHLA